MKNKRIRTSIQETWDWEEKMYKEYKDLSWEEMIKKIHKKSEEIIKEYKIELPTLELTTK